MLMTPCVNDSRRSDWITKLTTRFTRGVVMFAAVSVLAAPTVHAQPTGIPSMGVASSAELPPGLERTLGAAIMEQGRRDPSYIADPDIGQYLTALGHDLVRHASGTAGQPITVFALKDRQINAFALPGGYIGINSGLVVASQSESELASVVAHEIGHVLQRHIARGMTQSSQSSAIMLASLAGALLAAMAGSGDLAMGVAAFGQAAAVDRQLGFSRQAEQEADRVGFDMMNRAGYDPQGMLRMFNRLSHVSRLNEGAGGNVYTSTHPLSVQRMSDIENRIQSSASTARRDNPAFWYIRAKLRMLEASGTQARNNALAALQRDAQHSKGVEQAAAWYGIAYDARQRKDFAAAKNALANIGAPGDDSPEVAALEAGLALDQGDAEQALKLSRSAWARWPDSQAIALTLVDGLQKTGHDTQAVPFLQERINQWPDVPRFHQLLAQSQERLGQQVDARRSMATYYELIGALPTAVEQLQQARGLTSDFYLQSQLDVEIRALKERQTTERALLERFRKS